MHPIDAGAGSLKGDSIELLLKSKSRIYITGCSGWFGRTLLEGLLDVLGQKAFNERIRPFTSDGKTIQIRNAKISTLKFECLPQQRDDESVMLNFAYLTQEQAAGMPLEKYLKANRSISDTVFSSLAGINCHAVFMPSSGAVYRPHVLEVDINARNAYGKLKLEDEQRAFQLGKGTSGLKVIISRVFNVSGPNINKYSDYVLSSIVDSALKREPIKIRTAKNTLRSYVLVGELLSIAICSLLNPKQESVLFDTAGEEIVEINDLIREVFTCLELNVPVIRPPITEEIDRYLGDRGKYAQLLLKYNISPIPLREQILITADYIKRFPSV